MESKPMILSDKELARRGQRLLLTGLAVLVVAAVLALGLTVYSNVAAPGSGALTINAPGTASSPGRPAAPEGVSRDESPAPASEDGAAAGRTVRLTPSFAVAPPAQRAESKPSGKSPLPEGKTFDW